MDKPWKIITTIATLIVLVVSSNICSGRVRIIQNDAYMSLFYSSYLVETILNEENGDSLLEYLIENNFYIRYPIKIPMTGDKEIMPIIVKEDSAHMKAIYNHRRPFADSVFQINPEITNRIEHNFIDRLNRLETIYITPPNYECGDIYYLPTNTRPLMKDISARDTIKYPVMKDYFRYWIDSIRQMPSRKITPRLIY